MLEKPWQAGIQFQHSVSSHVIGKTLRGKTCARIIIHVLCKKYWHAKIANCSWKTSNSVDRKMRSHQASEIPPKNTDTQCLLVQTIFQINRNNILQARQYTGMVLTETQQKLPPSPSKNIATAIV